MGLCLEALKESENRSSYPNSSSGPEGLRLTNIVGQAIALLG